MERHKLLKDKRNETATDEKPKAEAAANQVEKNPARHSRSFIIPLRLELAGDRLSPLHEW